MASWNNATKSGATRGRVLDPEVTASVAGLRRDHRVSDALQPFVERYWSVTWDRGAAGPFRAEVLSDPCINVSVETGTHPRFGVELPAVLVHGAVTRRFGVDLHGRGRVSAAKFRPGGFTAMTGALPARGSVARLAGELRLDADRLLTAVVAEADDAARAAVLDALLSPAAVEPAADYLLLQAVLERMRSDRALLRVAHVAAECGLSLRALQRLFTHYVGVGPKAVLARHRLQEAVAALDTGQDVDLAELAASLGWYDQAHFSREFRAVIGRTPSAYRRAASA